MINLKEIRLKENITIDRLSELTGIDRGNISSIENNKRIPRIETIERILNALGYELVLRKKNKKRLNKNEKEILR